MSPTLERISFLDRGEESSMQRETKRLHIERYNFASRFAKGATVLDLACGVGYGSVILSNSGAASVVGVDVAPEAIAEANQEHSHPNVKYYAADYRHICNAASTPEALFAAVQKKFDLIVSLETIEHLPSPDDFLDTILSGLKTGGIFIGSAPVTPSMDANPYHLQDFSPKSFRRLVIRHGLSVIQSHRQVQKFNPFTVRSDIKQSGRDDLRSNLLSYYAQHPSKALLRAWSSVRYGFVNLIDTLAATKD